MPKNTAQRRIDSRRQNRATTISGVTLSGSPGSGGSAALAGDGLSYDGVALNVGAGTLVTVGADTVGITAGSTYQFVGTGAGTAAAWQNMSTLAGAGLTHAAGVLAVGAGSGITVNADDVALTTPGTLTAATSNSASGNHTHAVTTGAASTLTVATTNATGSSASLARADHLHTITTSSNPGAAAAILASTASGGLTLQSLAVQGSVDITNNGDLTVAGSGAYAGSSVLFVDSSGGNVGIMGAPDPQFALDVVGPCRATWFVGPHAIQLKDVLLLSHFDGRQPFETNYSGEPNGHMGQVATVSGGVIYRPGKFGTKAVQLAEATTNLCTNPSFETNTTGWSAYTSGGGAGSIAQSATEAYVGTYSLRVIKTSTTAGDRYGASFQVAVTSGTAYTFSAWVKVTSGGSPTLTIGEYITSANTANFTPTRNEWTHIKVSGTANATGTGTFYIWANDIGVTFYIDGVQIEAKAYGTPYCDGTLGTGHSWSGTAHASASSRTAAGLSYPTAGNVHDDGGTVMAWVYLHQVTNVAEVLRITGSSAGYIILRVQSGQARGYWGTSAIAGGTVALDTWTHLAMTYDGTTLSVYVNGVEVASGASSGFSGMPTTMYVGFDGSTSYANGKIDDLVITDSVIDADGIRAVYESDAPVFAESSRFSFRATPQGLVWADDEGLWMRNSTGGTVLGAYGGAATKSWAGLTLDPSDVVIGDSARGAFMRWDDSAGTLQLGKTGSTTTSLYLSGTDLSFRVNATERVSLTGAGVLSIKDSGGAAVFTFDASAGAEFTKPLTIGSSGGIYQGTGSFASPTTGLKIWAENSGGTYYGRIGGYNGGALQWYAGTDGKFYTSDSDGDALRIDATGVRLRMTSGSETFSNIVWCRPISTSDITTDYHGKILSSYISGSKTAQMQFRTYVNTDTDSSYEARTIIEAMGKVSGSTSGASIEVVRNRTQYYVNMNAYQVNFSGYLQCGVWSAPSGSPPSGYLYVWFNSSGSNYTLNVKNSSGTVKSVTLS